MKKTKEKFVTIASGEELPISKCKKINGVYYKVGDPSIENSGDCYLMGDNKYYLGNDGSLLYDNEVNSYALVKYSKNIINGIVGFNNKKEPIFGYFSVNKINNISIYLPNSNRYTLINKDVITRDNVFNTYREKLMDGDFYHISIKTAYELTRKNIPHNDYKHSLPYDSKGKTREFENYYKKNDLEINTISKKLANLFKDYTFGLEFETTKGFLTRRECYKNGLVPLRDGSITGIEYVTIPLQGEKGIQTVQNCVKILKEKTDFDEQCSLHLHIGNIPRTEEFILAFFVTTALLQNELFRAFPLYKKYNFGYKNKNYSAPYPAETLLASMDGSINNDNLIKNFDKLFTFLSEGVEYKNYQNNLDMIAVHPRNSDDNHKWQVNTRYFIHNLIPLIFGNKQTIEFRIHTPTYDINKIIAFMTINIQIIEYVKHNSARILKDMRIVDFRSILISNCSNGEEINFAEHVYDYFMERIRFNDQKCRESKLFFNESDVFTRFNIDMLNQELKFENTKSRISFEESPVFKTSYFNNNNITIDSLSSLGIKSTSSKKPVLKRQVEIDGDAMQYLNDLKRRNEQKQMYADLENKITSIPEPVSGWQSFTIPDVQKAKVMGKYSVEKNVVVGIDDGETNNLEF
jgi:hypothetical protein